MFITISIQTYNNAQSLASTLESLRNLYCPEGVDYEILVVNNNSSDDTTSVLERYADLPAPRLRAVFEARQGLSYARNRALAEARGDVVGFLDDDVQVDRGWLEAVYTAFTKYSAVVVGGRSYLIYPGGRPPWLGPERECILSKLDYGDEPLIGTDKVLFGLNLSVRKQAALAAGGFRVDFGRNARSLVGGEEEEFLSRIRKGGGLVVYYPQAVVGHVIPPERLSRMWFFRRCYADGVTSKKLMMAGGNAAGVGSALELLVRCWGSLARTFLFDYRSPRDLFDKQIYAVRSTGVLMESLRSVFKSGR